MSMMTANVEPLLGPDSKTGSTGVEVKKPRKRAYKARVSTKVKWALEDQMQVSRSAQMRMQRILEGIEEARTIAETTEDARMLMVLGKLDHEIAGLALDAAEMERIAMRAMAECKPQAKQGYSAQ